MGLIVVIGLLALGVAIATLVAWLSKDDDAWQ